MNIAVVCPSPVPFAIGGMEYLVWGLFEHINKDTPHKAELIKVPTEEGSFWSVIESYRKFYNLDLSHFDMILTTKYPAWMVRHPNQVCYMAHRLRGVYDTYHLTNYPTEVVSDNPHINRILDYIKSPSADLDGFFELMDELYAIRESIPEEYFSHPGPFIRKIIHFMDDTALSSGNIRKFYSISKTVKNRLEYFPQNAVVDALYPPPFIDYYEQGKFEYIFTISRLDGPKRIDLMVEAMKYVKSDIKFKIAGTGPQEKKLKKMAKGDDRIEFLGFISDDEAVECYKDARGVLFMPYDEDYGLVTIEAMKSGKPVLTCHDSGGPTEFVEDGVNGYVCAPDPKDIAKKIDLLCELSDEEVYEMGQRGFEIGSKINWKATVEELTSGKDDRGSSPLISKTDDKLPKKLTIASTFPIYPPRGGGQARTYNLYKYVAKKYGVDVVSFTNTDEPAFTGVIAPNFKEVRIPKSPVHAREEWKIEQKVGIPVTDIAMIKLAGLTEEYGKALGQSIGNSDVIILSHPFLLVQAKKHMKGKPYIYEAQDVEYIIKKGMLPDNREGRRLLRMVYNTEKECCQQSEFIITCSKEDRESLCKLYNVERDKIIVVPNGVDCSDISFIDRKQRQETKRKLGLGSEHLALFVGSWHPPNLEACEFIFQFARETPDIKYLLMGSQCMAFEGQDLPPNVGMLGIVDEETKDLIFGTVDVALNPMMSGSGTNLKMFDYMAAGIPVITTEFGSRGIEDRENLIIATIEDMPKVISESVNSDLSELTHGARKYVEDHFDWAKLADTLIDRLDKMER